MLNDGRDGDQWPLEDALEAGTGDVPVRPPPVIVLLGEGGGTVVNHEVIEEIHERSYFGRLVPGAGTLFLYPEEIMVIAERKRLLALPAGFGKATTEFITSLLAKWGSGGIAIIEEHDELLDEKALTEHFTSTVDDFWEKYVVYRDLKTRGYVVRRGIEDISHFRVFKKGDKKDEGVAKWIYFSVFEGKPLSLHKLHAISDHASVNRQELILAVVDRNMDITYYSVKKQDL